MGNLAGVESPRTSFLSERESELYAFRHLREVEGDGFVVTDREGVVRYIDPLAEAMFHRRAEDFLGKPFGYCVVDGDHSEIEIIRPDGTRSRAEMRVVVTDWSGSEGFLISLHRIDDLQKQKLKESLQKSNNRFRTLINASPLAIVSLNGDGSVMFWSRTAERLFGWDGHEVLGQQPPIASLDGEDEFAQLCSRALQGEEIRGVELLRQRRRDGSPIDIGVWVSPLDHASGFAGGVMAVIADITEHKRVEEQIRHLVTHDGLTGLPNRDLLCDRISQALLAEERYRQGNVAVLHIGIVNFRTVTETLGFVATDALLGNFAGRLADAIRGSDTLARYGSSEFSIMLPQVEDEQGAAEVARKILASLAEPFVVNKQEVFLSVNIGIAVSLSDGLDSGTLLRNAEIAMHRAREEGYNQYQFFTQDMNVEAMTHVLMTAGLRHALERHELRLHYQPIMDLEHGHLVAMEALLRWQHPDLGLIMPDRFIPLAEKEGLIVSIGEWVLWEGCQQIKRWELDGLHPPRLAVNLSARQFSQPEFPSRVASVLAETNTPAEKLELELTESMLIEHVGRATETLSTLKAMGIRLSIDDFGTGYSSLSYLKRFPLDTLKIDRSFVSGIPEDGDDIQLCSAIVAMAHGLGLKVIAEGVETPEQLEFMRGLHCDEVQGFHISKPLPPEMADTFLRRRRSIN